MDIYKMVLIFSAYFQMSDAQNCKNEPRCSYTRVKGMKAADCFDKIFREFPRCVANDVEIIDLSFNRIKKINKEDLNRYSYLKMLYLQDNKIVSIDKDIFHSDLQTLDLSINSISELPAVVFHLPSLKTLYLGQNWNMNIADTVEKTKPITSPLVHLDISYILVDEPGELPDLSIMPFLAKYNISGNKISVLRTKHFAGLCDLQILDTTNVTAEFEKSCDCWIINNWLRDRSVRFNRFECGINESECPDEIPREDLQIYQRCREQIEQIVQHSRLLKILIPCTAVILIILVGIIYYVIKRRRQKRKEIEKRAAPPLLTVFNK